MLSFWPSLSLLIFFLVIFLECRAVGARVTLPLKSFLLFFGYGCIGAPLLALVLQQIPFFRFEAVAADGSYLSPAAWLTAPPIEEFAKAFPILVLAFLFRESRRLSIADFALAGFASGIGFGFVEANLKALANGTPASFQHLSGLGFETAQRIATDYIVTFAGHPVYPALIGLAAGAGLRFIPARRDVNWTPAAFVFLLASFDHAMFNWKTLHPASALAGFPDAPKFVELLYSVTLHGRLETWLLPLALVASGIVEAWLCAKVLGRRPDLLLRFEIGPWVINEWLVALLRLSAGRTAFLRTLDYFRRRRAFAISLLESKRYPNERALARHARFLELKLKRERQILRDPPRGVWFPPQPMLKRSLQTWAWRTRGVFAFAVLFFLLFMLGEDQLPHGLRQFLFGRVFTAVVVALGLGFAGWGIYRLWRAPRPDLVATESADYVGYQARLFLLGASLASGVFPALSLILGWKALVPGAAYLSSYLPGWIGQGGNPNTLMGLGAMGGSVEWDANPTTEALRHELSSGEERITKLEQQIEAKLPAARAAAPFERQLDDLLDLLADLDAERDAHEHRKLAFDEAERQAAEKSGEDPALAVQAVKDEFQRLDRELGAAAADQLARIAAFEEAYAEIWAEIMRELDSSDAARAEISESLNKLWRAHRNPGWALRIAAVDDEIVLPSFALLIPELEAIASESDAESDNLLREAIARIRTASTRVVEEPAVEEPDSPAEVPGESELSSDVEQPAEEFALAAEEAASSGETADAGLQLDLFAQRAARADHETQAGPAEDFAVEEEAPTDEPQTPAEPLSDSIATDDGMVCDLESVAPQPYHVVPPSYVRLLQQASDFLRMQPKAPEADDIAAIDALVDEDFDLEDDDTETLPPARDAEIAAQPDPASALEVETLEPETGEEAAQPLIAEPETPPAKIGEIPEGIAVTGDSQSAAPTTDPALPPMAIAMEATVEPPAIIVRLEEETPPPSAIDAYVDKLDAFETLPEDFEEPQATGRLGHAEALLSDGDEETGFAADPAPPIAPPAPETSEPNVSAPPKTSRDPLIDAALSFSYFGIVREFNGMRAKMRAPTPRPATPLASAVPASEAVKADPSIEPAKPQPPVESATPVIDAPVQIELPTAAPGAMAETQPVKPEEVPAIPQPEAKVDTTKMESIEPPIQVQRPLSAPVVAVAESQSAGLQETPAANEPELEVEAKPRDWDWDVPHAQVAHADESPRHEERMSGLVRDEADAARAAKRAEDALDHLRAAMGPEPANLNPITDSEVADCLAAQLQIAHVEAANETTPKPIEALAASVEEPAPTPTVITDPAPTPLVTTEPSMAPMVSAAEPVRLETPASNTEDTQPERKGGALRDVIHGQPKPAPEHSLRDIVDGPRTKPQAARRSWFRKVADIFAASPDAAAAEDENVYLPQELAAEEPQPAKETGVAAPSQGRVEIAKAADAPATVRAGWDQYRDALDRLKDTINSDGQPDAIKELHLAEHVTAGLKKPQAPGTVSEVKGSSSVEASQRSQVFANAVAIVEAATSSSPQVVAAKPEDARGSAPAPEETPPQPRLQDSKPDVGLAESSVAQTEPLLAAVAAVPVVETLNIAVIAETVPAIATEEIAPITESAGEGAAAAQTEPVPAPKPSIDVLADISTPKQQPGPAQSVALAVPIPETPSVPVLVAKQSVPAPAAADTPAKAAVPEVIAEIVVAKPAPVEKTASEIRTQPALASEPRKRARNDRRKDAPAPPPRIETKKARDADAGNEALIDLNVSSPGRAAIESSVPQGGAAEDGVLDLKLPKPIKRQRPARTPELADDDIVDLKLPALPVQPASAAPRSPVVTRPAPLPPAAPPPAAAAPLPLPKVETRAAPAVTAPLPAPADLTPSQQVQQKREYRNGLERLRVGVKLDEALALENAAVASGRANGSGEAAAARAPVKVGFDRKQPRRDFVAAAHADASGANNTKAPAPSVDPSSAAALAAALADYFGKLNKPQPPMHITDRAGFKKLVDIGMLDAPYRGRATWSFSGMLAKGEVAIRLKPGAEKFVELVPSVETFGQIPNFYARGVGVGECRLTVPAEHLQYFDIPSRQWLAVKR
ncbi:MAG TPA: PrsW family glutamic-type intramembrane protease [Micropepsaceae bacterium]|nr:PrsW family glutamic-type intramembrane protease [Micropepsaceae bacterium]